MENEKRLIDANEIEELFYKQVAWGATDLMDAFDDALQDAQTVYAVEVVRCEDCKHYKPQKPYPTYKGSANYCCRCAYVKVSAGDFCSYGERREGE